jgi:hypothetical protein
MLLLTAAGYCHRTRNILQIKLTKITHLQQNNKCNKNKAQRQKKVALWEFFEILDKTADVA